MKTDNDKIINKVLELQNTFNIAEQLQLCAMILAGMSMDLKRGKEE